MPTALITGISGQDGSYLAELLLAKGYDVVGLSRTATESAPDRIKKIDQRIHAASGDLLDQASLEQVLIEYKPSEVYNLAAHSFLPDHRSQPAITADVAALGVTRLLDAIRTIAPRTRFFQASSSEMFGNSAETPQTETTPFAPQNLYAIAKVYAHSVTKYHREAYGIYACSGILFNHESPRRNTSFVTRKITHAAAKIKLGMEHQVSLGSLDARRDWGFAGDFVNAMWLILQQDVPNDYVLATGETHTIRELCEVAFSYVGLDYRNHVVQDERFMRSPETAIRVGNPRKAEEILGWRRTVGFQRLIELMVDEDINRLQ